MAMKAVGLSVVLLAACADNLATADKPALDYEGLASALRARGARVESGGSVEQPFFATNGRFLKVNGDDAQVFQYRDVMAARAEAARVSADGSAIGTAKPFWAGPPHFYARDRLIVLYVGDTAAVKTALEGVLGTQFAGK